ncbi:MAG: hypothetical protein R2854_11385 [Caldilineaceae bacterium]
MMHLRVGSAKATMNWAFVVLRRGRVERTVLVSSSVVVVIGGADGDAGVFHGENPPVFGNKHINGILYILPPKGVFSKLRCHGRRPADLGQTSVQGVRTKQAARVVASCAETVPLSRQI